MSMVCLQRLVIEGELCGDGGDRHAVQLPESRVIEGRVGGPAPWHRLAVAAIWPRSANQHRIPVGSDEPMALVRPDRSFTLFAPVHDVDLLVFDVESGVPLDWRRVETGASGHVEVACDAVSVVIELVRHASDDAADLMLGYTPTEPCWPEDVEGMLPFRSAAGLIMQPLHRMRLRAGPRTTLWLRRRAGKLVVAQGGMPWGTFELDDDTPSYSLPLPFR